MMTQNVSCKCIDCQKNLMLKIQDGGQLIRLKDLFCVIACRNCSILIWRLSAILFFLEINSRTVQRLEIRSASNFVERAHTVADIGPIAIFAFF